MRSRGGQSGKRARGRGSEKHEGRRGRGRGRKYRSFFSEVERLVKQVVGDLNVFLDRLLAAGCVAQHLFCHERLLEQNFHELLLVGDEGGRGGREGKEGKEARKVRGERRETARGDEKGRDELEHVQTSVAAQHFCIKPSLPSRGMSDKNNDKHATSWSCRLLPNSLALTTTSLSSTISGERVCEREDQA
eukprot:767369-Hanusia_phi.AAC.2